MTLATRLLLATVATLATVAILFGSYVDVLNLALPTHFA